MRIGLVGTYYRPVIGGVETHMSDLAGRLRDRGLEVTVSCLNRGYGELDLPDHEVVDGISLHRVASIGVGEVLRWPGRLIEAKSTDLVHFHGFSRLLVLRTLVDKERRPLVITLHGGLLGVGTDHVRARRIGKRVFDRVLALPILRRAARVVALSEEEARYLHENIGLGPERICMLPNPIPDEASVPAAVEQGISGRLIVLARLAKRKRIPDLLEALAANPDLPDCDIVGPDDDDTERIRAIASALPPGRVRLLGPTTGKSKFKLIRSATALVLCSEWEGHSVAALEAIAQGTPVVASRNAAVGLPGGATLTYSEGGRDDLAMTIRSLQNTAVLRRLRRGLDGARRQLVTASQYADRLIAIYTEAFAGS